MVANRIWIWGLLVAAVVSVLWYRGQVMSSQVPPEAKTTRVFFVTGGNDEFWQLTVKGAEAAAAEYDAVLEVKMPLKGEGFDLQQQILLGINSDDFDGVALSPLDADGQTRMINLLADKVHVVTFDSDAPHSQRQYYIGTSNYRAGQICQDLVREAVPEGGKVAVLLSNLTKNNMEERKVGYEEKQAEWNKKAESPQWETVNYLTDEGEIDKTKENILRIIEEHEDLACIVGMNGYHGPTFLQVLEEAGKLGQIKLVAFDEAKETLAGIASGDIYATVAQDPFKYGYEAVRMLNSLHNGHDRELPIVGGGAINVNCQPIRQQDLKEFQERLNERLGEEVSAKE